jgi:hypothetical protein
VIVVDEDLRAPRCWCIEHAPERDESGRAFAVDVHAHNGVWGPDLVTAVLEARVTLVRFAGDRRLDDDRSVELARERPGQQHANARARIAAVYHMRGG